jgi:hypothetical protein
VQAALRARRPKAGAALGETPSPAPPTGMQLHTGDGSRKYLTPGERDAFLRAAEQGRKVKDFRYARKGVPHLRVSGKGGKTRRWCTCRTEHAISRGGARGGHPQGRRYVRRSLRVLDAKSSPALDPRFVACNTTRQNRILRAMSIARHDCTQ